MTTLDGQLYAAEATGIAGAIRRRQLGPPWYLLSVVLILVFMYIGGEMEAFLSRGSDANGRLLGSLIGAAVGAPVYFRLARWLFRRQFRARLAARGLGMAYPVHIEIGDDLVQEVGSVTQRAQWSCVTELFRAGGYWVFLAQSCPIVVPRRLFVDADSERDFLGQALTRMSPAARKMSPQATAAAGPKGPGSS